MDKYNGERDILYIIHVSGHSSDLTWMCVCSTHTTHIICIYISLNAFIVYNVLISNDVSHCIVVEDTVKRNEI
jgi:hypothetical protein